MGRVSKALGGGEGKSGPERASARKGSLFGLRYKERNAGAGQHKATREKKEGHLSGKLEWALFKGRGKKTESETAWSVRLSVARNSGTKKKKEGSHSVKTTARICWERGQHFITSCALQHTARLRGV